MRKPKLRIFHNGKMDIAADIAIGAPEGMIVPDDLVVMISTSVRDIEGKEIFEGDICERECGDTLCEDKHIGIVAYDAEQGCYILHNPKKETAWPMVANILDDDGHKIIDHIKPKLLGNGYETPELYKLL